jgi:hypothetical protein
MVATRVLVLGLTAGIALGNPLLAWLESPSYGPGALFEVSFVSITLQYGWLLSPVLLVTSAVLWASTRRKHDAAATIVGVVWLCVSLYYLWGYSRVYG